MFHLNNEKRNIFCLIVNIFHNRRIWNGYLPYIWIRFVNKDYKKRNKELAFIKIIKNERRVAPP